MTTPKAFSFRGASPPDPLTRGSAPGPRWGHSPQTPIIGCRSALAIWPPPNCTPGSAPGQRIAGKWQLIGNSQCCGSAMLQLQHTPPPQSTTPGLHPVSIHQMALPCEKANIRLAYYSIYRPRKDERLSRPGWLVTYRNKMPPPGVEPAHVTHPSTNRARRRVTSLIRPTPLPLRHAAPTYIHCNDGNTMHQEQISKLNKK